MWDGYTVPDPRPVGYFPGVRHLWDTTAGTFTAYDEQGNVTETRPLTPGEVADYGHGAASEASTAALQAMLPTLAPALAQAQTDAAAYPTLTNLADRQAVIARLIPNVAALAQAVDHICRILGVDPSA